MVTAPPRWLIAQFNRERVAAFILQSCFVLIGINYVAGLIEIFGADMQRLMNVADIVGKQNYRHGLRDFAIVLFGNTATQYIDAVTDHMHDVPLGSPSGAVLIFFRPNY